jgi:hypothetical protein
VLKIDDDIKKAQCSLFWVDVEARADDAALVAEKQTKLAAKAGERAAALEKAKAALARSKSPDEALAEINRLKGDGDAVTQQPLFPFSLATHAARATLW